MILTLDDDNKFVNKYKEINDYFNQLYDKDILIDALIDSICLDAEFGNDLNSNCIRILRELVKIDDSIKKKIVKTDAEEYIL